MIPEYLWAKTAQDNCNLYHPLLCHMLDVAAVAGLVWEHHLTGELRKRLERAMCCPERVHKTQIMFLAGAHDIGKATPGFQKREPDISEFSGLPFSDNDLDKPHGFVTASVLSDFIGASQRILGQISGGHHGVFPRSENLLHLGASTLGNLDWKKTRCEILKEFSRIIGFETALQPAETVCDPAIVPIMAGFISVVDWIGSNQEFFPCIAECGNNSELDFDRYWHDAQEKAQQALIKLGWLPAVSFEKEAPFGQVFSGFIANPLQTVVIEHASGQSVPYLMIIEAPMGEGKTEAALYAADMAMCRGFAKGLYIAMPTQATSNAMFKRVLEDYLRKRGHKGKLNLQLIHGDALLAQLSEVQEGEVPTYKSECIGEDEADVEAQSWFTAKKRPLLAPFGVGTIDQSLLSVLQTKHWFVRLFGLAGKVVIFDEVHAYDAYMSTILERLLHWLAELDCTVILLSATLPDAKRKTLVKAYSGYGEAEYKRYPRITLTKPRHYPGHDAGQLPVCTEIPMGESRPVGIEYTGSSVNILVETFARRLEQGGCAAVICNTVNRSIEVFTHLRNTLKDTECILFHARTLQMWRREREADVLRKFGKHDPQLKDSDGLFVNTDRPFRAVLVATQVIEQSLDLDFDLMISEIAPADLLLQRMGRLHRHPRQRPAGLESPQFIVLCDADQKGAPPESFGGGIEYVYDRYILLRTWLALRGREMIDIPGEIEELIEAVYNDIDTSEKMDEYWRGAMEKAFINMEGEMYASKCAARQLLVGEPKDPTDLIEEFNIQLIDEEDPRAHATIRAATRLGDPSITVVMVPEGTKITFDPSVAEVRRLLDCSVKLSHKELFQHFLHHVKVPEEWEKNTHLRYARLLRLNGKNQGRAGNCMLTVDKQLGVVIEKKEV